MFFLLAIFFQFLFSLWFLLLTSSRANHWSCQSAVSPIASHWALVPTQNPNKKNSPVIPLTSSFLSLSFRFWRPFRYVGFIYIASSGLLSFNDLYLQCYSHHWRLLLLTFYSSIKLVIVFIFSIFLFFQIDKFHKNIKNSCIINLYGFNNWTQSNKKYYSNFSLEGTVKINYFKFFLHYKNNLNL